MALSNATFTDISGAASDIFSSQLGAKGLRIKAAGDFAEAQEYDLAGQLATQNAQFTKTSTEIKEMQEQRRINLALGGTRADVASSGFETSGSALDILRDSASQGALTKAVLGQQGLIQEAGYKEQAQSYSVMSEAARSAGAAENELASQTSLFGGISAGIKTVAAIASLA